ncbi:alpha/beta fold hydrolase [Streptomyces cellulosae]
MATGVTAPERLGRTKLRSGCRIGWAEWGPESGRPVLLCAGSATSRWLGLNTAVVTQLGVRLVTVDRPGLGVSDAGAEWDLEDWTRGIRELAVVRGLADLTAVGFSIGGPFALACAAAGIVTGVSIVSGTDEIAHPIFAEALEPETRVLVQGARSDPRATERRLRDAADAEALWEVVTDMAGDTDRQVYRDPPYAIAHRRALAEGFAQGPAGYARETVLALSRWPFAPHTISVPVDLWYSEQDANPFHSPDLGASLAARIPTARRHLVAGAGEALLWTRTREILTSLLNRPSAH